MSNRAAVTARLAAVVVDAADPAAVATFWQHLLGGVLQGTACGEVGLITASCELRFRAHTAPKSVKNRVHPDIYVPAVEPLLDLGATVLAEYLPERVTLADIEGNEFCAFLDAARAGPGAKGRAGREGPDLLAVHRQRSARSPGGVVGGTGRGRGRAGNRRHTALALRIGGLAGVDLEVRPGDR
jgi:Glyoxalase-like domain